jgi:hypothetical protein
VFFTAIPTVLSRWHCGLGAARQFGLAEGNPEYSWGGQHNISIWLGQP